MTAQVNLAIQAAQDRKALDLRVLDLGENCSFTSYFVICTSTSTRHAQAICDGIVEGLKKSGCAPTHVEGYSKAEWVDVIGNANAAFQQKCQSKYLAGRTVTLAKDKGDVNADGNDLYIEFSDAFFGKDYRLRVSVHFIDPKTNSEIASIPLRKYTGRLCGLVSCLDKELEEVGSKLQLHVTGDTKKK